MAHDYEDVAPESEYTVTNNETSSRRSSTSQKSKLFDDSDNPFITEFFQDLQMASEDFDLMEIIDTQCALKDIVFFYDQL